MVFFFKVSDQQYIAVHSVQNFSSAETNKLSWLFGNALKEDREQIEGIFVGPRKEMITPWSTNAVEITQNMGLSGILRIEEYFKAKNEKVDHDSMLQSVYTGLDQEIFHIKKTPDPLLYIDDIEKFNKKEGLALNLDEIAYLENLSLRIGRKLTDSEVFGFSQVNSEHCRHKIFNGLFIIDGIEKKSTLFELIKKTTKSNPNKVVSAYKDNCSFVEGPVIEQFAPASHDKADFFITRNIESILSLKAETHNFPTTVEPFNGAATGTGGEIRDRIAGGKGALPMAGTAVYMTSYPRTDGNREWEKGNKARPWLYQSPSEILIKASNGASDFGNKFGQPLICGSLLTFEHTENLKTFGFDKVIMLAGGIGYGKKADSEKDTPEKGDVIIMLGGDNYRIGMGGGAVSSVATGEYNNSIELNAVQRANPEMQKRVFNAIRAYSESENNMIVSIHDHGAGGHLNCFSELVEETGGKIDITKLPIGDPTLSAKEIVGNESQERMGLVMKKTSVDELKKIADRERAPLYIVGEITGDHIFTFENSQTKEKAIDLELLDMFGNPPQTILNDKTGNLKFDSIEYNANRFEKYLEQVIQLEAVACKDWLTNKVDRSVTGKIAKQQCAGELQLPLNNHGAVALDFRGIKGYATSIGHAPVPGLIDPAAGSVLSIAEALTNIIWAPLSEGIKSISLSANWMWPCKNPGEDSRLYKAVEAASEFAIALGTNIPTGKDSLSMTQKYDKDVVFAPGTVIISAAAEVSDIRMIVEPVIKVDPETLIAYIDLSKDEKKLGGSSFAQSLGKLGEFVPTIKDPEYFAKAFNLIQTLVQEGKILSGHDISAGGMITTLLEMCFANTTGGLDADLTHLKDKNTFTKLFSENPGIIIQVRNENDLELLKDHNVKYHIIAKPSKNRMMKIKTRSHSYSIDIDEYRDKWYKTSYLLDSKQTKGKHAHERFLNYKNQPVEFKLHKFNASFAHHHIHPDRKTMTGIPAAIIREKGVNGDREMAYAMYLAGMDVKDIHMTDLISGRENLEDVNMIVFVGGFANSDVLGSAKGWAGAFKYNEKAKLALENFYKRNDTLSLGVCNGCQLMVELGLVYPQKPEKAKLVHNDSGKFESAFLNVDIQPNHSIMLNSLAGLKLGIWVAHGEGKFILTEEEDKYHIPIKYSRSVYPGNPNGSAFNTAAICSDDGRHLAMMPHLERAFLPYQCAIYPDKRKNDNVTPWMEAFVNARNWMAEKVQKSN
jgi:phosphoribosylformylglycinamidine synthase